MHQNNGGMARPRRLIVNADDFGISETVNEAVIRAFTEGVLTSCSLMVTGEAFEHAVGLAHAHPDLAVGIHLVTVLGRAVLPSAEIPTLVDAAGNFAANSVVAGLKYYFLPQARRELHRELSAQFEKFAATGLRLSHIDGHLHMHVHPVVFRAAVELGTPTACGACGCHRKNTAWPSTSIASTPAPRPCIRCCLVNSPGACSGSCGHLVLSMPSASTAISTVARWTSSTFCTCSTTSIPTPMRSTSIRQSIRLTVYSMPRHSRACENSPP